MQGAEKTNWAPQPIKPFFKEFKKNQPAQQPLKERDKPKIVIKF